MSFLVRATGVWPLTGGGPHGPLTDDSKPRMTYDCNPPGGLPKPLAQSL